MIVSLVWGKLEPELHFTHVQITCVKRMYAQLAVFFQNVNNLACNFSAEHAKYNELIAQ